MTLYAGIDGGQTSTTAIVGDADGNVLGRGTAGPADEVGCDATSTRLKDALEGALAAALADASLPRGSRFAAVVAGVSGFGGIAVGVAPEFNADRTRVVHDAPIAHAGAFAGGPGIVAIAGTGSIVYALGDDGRTFVAGGLGYAFGDEGSAFGIARAAIALADSDASMRDRVQRFFERDGAIEVARAFYAGALSRDRIAGFAHALVETPDERVERIVDAQVGALASQIERARAELGTRLPVAAIGGMTKNAYYIQRLARLVRLAHPHADPASGALTMARLG